MNKQIKTEKKIHQGYWSKDKAKAMGIPQIFGKYQYIYSSKKGEISLIRLKDYLRKSHNFWEIYSLKGNLFEDVERFGTKEEAEKRINEVL